MISLSSIVSSIYPVNELRSDFLKLFILGIFRDLSMSLFPSQYLSE